MLIKANFSYNKLSYISYLVLFFTFIFSINLYSYIHDPHHHGLVFSNALDLLKGKVPYNEIFIQYGFLTTFLHAVVLKIFGLEIIYLNYFTSIIYYFSVYLISKTVKILTDEFYGCLSIFLILFNHPITWLPWSNYLGFFFITLAIYYYVKGNFLDNYKLGFFLSLSILSRQDFFFPLIVFSLLFFFLKFILEKKIYIKFIISFILPLIIFLSFIFFFGLFENWSKTLVIPFLYLELNNTELFSLIFSFLNFFLFKAFFNYINEPQYILILIILITNFFFIIKNLFSKNLDSIFLPLLCTSLSITSINYELFRLYTSVIIGVIPLLQFIFLFKIRENKFFFNFILIYFSLFSIFFYPLGGNKLFNSLLLNKNETNIAYLKNVKLDKNDIKLYKEILELKEQVLKNCNIKYYENLTFNSFISSLLGGERIVLKPFIKSNTKNSIVETYFDNKFILKINNQFTYEDIILIFTDNNLEYDLGKIFVPSNYSTNKIIVSDKSNKPFVYNFIYPSKCISRY